MKKIIVTSLIVLVSFLISGGIANASPVSWDGNFSTKILQPLTSFSNSVVKVHSLTATSTTATSTFAGPVSVGGLVSEALVSIYKAAGAYPTLELSNAGSGDVLSIIKSGTGNSFTIDTNEFLIANNGRLGMGTSTPGTIISLGNTGANTINISQSATSSFGKGINLRSGCFSILDVCILDGFFNTAGRSLTASGNTIEADAELYTQSSTYNYASSSLALSTYPVLAKKFPQAATISTISCQNIGSGTSTVMFEERTSLNTAGTDVLYSAGLSAGGDLELASSTLSNNSMASGAWLVMLIDAVTGTPSNPVCDVKYTYND